jgi:uncharacterized membrane protein
MEEVGEGLKKAWEAVKEFFKKMWEHITMFFKKVKAGALGLKKAAESFKKAVGEIGSKEPSVNGFENAPLAKAFGNDKPEAILDAAIAIVISR